MSKLQTFDPRKKSKAVNLKRALKEEKSILSTEIEDLDAYVERKLKSPKGAHALIKELAILIRTKL